MAPHAAGVTILPEGTGRARARAIDVDAGTYLPAAFAGLRTILSALDAEVPALRERFVQQHPAEWNRLFPGSVRNAPDLSDLALSPSERRLHRESEQTFWILNVAARYIVEALKTTGASLVVRSSGESDLVSLRGLMRAAELARLEGVETDIVLTDWTRRRRHCAAAFQKRRLGLLDSLAKRMRAAPVHPSRIDIANRAPRPAVDLEGSYLEAVIDPSGSIEHRLAAAVLAVRASFFTTNYEGAMLAVEQGLSLLEAASGQVDQGRLLAAWESLDSGLVSPAIEIDRGSLGDGEELRALFHRSSGVVNAFCGDFDEALADFARGLECRISPERQGQLRMFRALTLIKRLGNIDRARSEIQAGLDGMKGREGSDRLLHEGWLRNVMALTYFQEKKLENAVVEEKLAIKCVGELHDPSATHLKINLISNLSVVQETAKRFDESIATWRRFEKISENWGDNFHKHHRYRLAGLTLGAGRVDEAISWYRSAYDSAERLNDVYHRQVIAAELGRQFVDRGEMKEAEGWFERAVGFAHAIGCPLRVGESVAGLALTRGGSDYQPAIAALEAGTSYPKETEKLLLALRSAQRDAVIGALPRPRSKLNRPFDLVNLY